jgi:hypothetical protein
MTLEANNGSYVKVDYKNTTILDNFGQDYKKMTLEANDGALLSR